MTSTQLKQQDNVSFGKLMVIIGSLGRYTDNRKALHYEGYGLRIRYCLASDQWEISGLGDNYEHAFREGLKAMGLASRDL